MLSTQKSLKTHNLGTDLKVQRNVDADKIHQLEDTVKILTEKIESLKLELNYKNHEIEEIKQELIYTNHELCIVINRRLTS